MLRVVGLVIIMISVLPGCESQPARTARIAQHTAIELHPQMRMLIEGLSVSETIRDLAQPGHVVFASLMLPESTGEVESRTSTNSSRLQVILIVAPEPAIGYRLASWLAGSMREGDGVFLDHQLVRYPTARHMRPLMQKLNALSDESVLMFAMLVESPRDAQLVFSPEWIRTKVPDGRWLSVQIADAAPAIEG